MTKELDALIAGALFDFMGMLTSQPEKTQFSSSDDAAPAVKQIEKFAAKRGLSLDEANVTGWAEALRAQQEAPIQAQPVALALKAASDAATSLETISSLAGRKTFGAPPIETFMGGFEDVRSYASSRAVAARKDIAAAMLAAAPKPEEQPVVPKGGHPFPHHLENPDGRALKTAAFLLRRQGYIALADSMGKMADTLLASSSEAPEAQPVVLKREEFADDVVKLACETDPSDPDHPNTIKISTDDLRQVVLSAFLQDDGEAAPVSQEPARVALIKARTALETCVQDELEGGGGAQYFEDDAVDAAIREIDAFLAAQAAPVVDAPELVTRESALNAIALVSEYNGPGRERAAIKLLVKATP
jgi:hypothetical protein